jgi:hypothetical protein
VSYRLSGWLGYVDTLPFVAGCLYEMLAGYDSANHHNTLAELDSQFFANTHGNRHSPDSHGYTQRSHCDVLPIDHASTLCNCYSFPAFEWSGHKRSTAVYLK